MAAPTVVMTAPASFGGTVTGCPSGQVYVLNASRQVTAQYADVRTLSALGFVAVNFPSGSGQLGALLGANMNSTADQAIPLFINPASIFRVTRFIFTNASTSLTTAVGGIYTAPAKATGQGVLVTNSQVYSSLTSGTLMLDVLPSPNYKLVAGTNLYLSLTTAQGAAATADVYLVGDVFPR